MAGDGGGVGVEPLEGGGEHRVTPRQAVAFFCRREFIAEPDGLGFGIGPGETLAGPLDRKPELVEQTRDVMVVVPNTEALLDEASASYHCSQRLIAPRVTSSSAAISITRRPSL